MKSEPIRHFRSCPHPAILASSQRPRSRAMQEPGESIMTIPSSGRRPIRRCLTAVGILGSVLLAGSMAATAGECPADQVVADGQGQKAGATKPKDGTDNVLTRIDLLNEPVMLKDHALRL